MSNLKWYWPASNRGNAGGREGAGLDEFSNDYIGNLAREIIQNSIDAKMDGQTVEVEFSTFTTTKDFFPGLEDYYFNYVEEWIKQDKESGESEVKERSFMEKIRQCILSSERNKIKWLRISDKGTTGLRGVSDPWNMKKPWFAFINGSGKDVKGEGSGGSKGLGKNAIFVNSHIRTIFVSTITCDGEKGNIGYAKLISKKITADENNRPDWTQGIGYCVSEEAKNEKLNTPNDDVLNIDPLYIRNEIGTDIFIPFFSGDEDWAQRLISEAIISFMPAIIKGELKVSVYNKEKSEFFDVDNNKLYSRITDVQYFEKDSIRVIAEELYKTISYPTLTKIIDEESGNEMQIFISTKSKSVLNKVYTYRWNAKMRIETFSVDSNVPYTGVIFIKGKDLCDKLKSIEDATHKSWNISKWKDTTYTKQEIKQARDSVREFAQKELQKIEDSEFGNTSDFDWANDEGWNADSSSDTLEVVQNGEEGLPEDEVNFESTKKQEKAKRKPRKPKATEKSKDGSAEEYQLENGIEQEGGDESGSHPDGHNKGNGNDPHPGPEDIDVIEDKDGKKMMIRKTVSTISSHMPVKDIKQGIFKLDFIPSKSGEDVEIQIVKSGTGSENEGVKILEAVMDSNYLSVENNRIHLDKMEMNRRYEITVKLNVNKIYIWEVNLNANE